MITAILYGVLGITAGALSGLIGIGGGVIIVPALVFVFGFSQHAAHTCLGFLLRSVLRARVAIQLQNLLLGRIFGGARVLIGLRMLLAR
jgi:uncharacterized membrane protein YfcA